MGFAVALPTGMTQSPLVPGRIDAGRHPIPRHPVAAHARRWAP